MHDSRAGEGHATVADLIARGERELVTAGVVCAQGTTTPRDDAAAIVYHVLGLEHSDPHAYVRVVTPVEEARCAALFARRGTERLPVAYLLGEARFAGLAFHVDPRVLIPRSPFAELIEARFVPWCMLPARPRILELCTGSGCIAVACAVHLSDAEVVATDLSAPALEVARENVRRHGVGARVRLVQADLYAGITGRFDLVLANPPYVPEAELAGAPPEFGWEPHMALAGGRDGLDLVRPIVAGAARHLAPGGLLAIEVGAGTTALEAAFPRVPFAWPSFERGGDGIALVAAADLPRENAGEGQPAPAG
jgi:ribosomal protein L3 glutamine methyltransferase